MCSCAAVAVGVFLILPDLWLFWMSLRAHKHRAAQQQTRRATRNNREGHGMTTIIFATSPKISEWQESKAREWERERDGEGGALFF